MITFCIILSFLSFTIGTQYPTVEPPLVCKVNEVLNPCPGYCTFDSSCAELIGGLMRSCAAPPLDYQCQPRCECKKGLVRTDFGCESVDKCCTGINEEITDCPAPCDETCVGKPAADCQLRPCFAKGCRCKPGYVRDAKGICIAKSQCVVCKENEEYSTCGTCERSCKNLNPICTFDCKIGCFCKDGFVRDANGNCIAEKMCPQNQCTGPNEEYSECINPCPKGAMCFAPCLPGCICKKGFIRQDGVCVKETPQETEYPCTGPNEELSGCPPCPPGRLCPAVVCRPTCVCKQGFVRKNGICTKETEPLQCTGPNEVFSNCVKFVCPPGNKCPAIACRPGCVCKKGYVRKNGVCVININIPYPTIDPIIRFETRPEEKREIQ